MAQLVAAQQGLAVANNVYSSQIAQDFLAQGSITHKVLYAGILGGVGYLIGTLAFGEGLEGTIKTTTRAAVGGVPIFGAIANLINDAIDPPKEKKFLQKYGPAIGGASGVVIGMMLG